MPSAGLAVLFLAISICTSLPVGAKFNEISLGRAICNDLLIQASLSRTNRSCVSPFLAVHPTHSLTHTLLHPAYPRTKGARDNRKK